MGKPPIEKKQNAFYNATHFGIYGRYMSFALEAEGFKKQLVDRALVLVAGSYVLLLAILQARYFFDDTYETPVFSQILIVYGLFCCSTP